MAEENPAAQRQIAVAAYFTSCQLLLFAWRQLYVLSANIYLFAGIAQ